MSILFRYISREYLRVLGLALGTLVLIYVVSEFFSKIGKFTQSDADLGTILSYFGLKIPRAAYETLPIAALMASLLTMNTLSRQSEITAMKSCGIGLFRIASPILALSFALSATAFAANWSWIPSAMARANVVKTTGIEGQLPTTLSPRTRIWMRLERRTFLNVQMADPGKQTLYGVHRYRLDDHFSLIDEIEAPEVRYQDGIWTASAGIHRAFKPDGSMEFERFTNQVIDLPKRPDEFAQVQIKEEYLAYPQLRAYVKDLVRSGIDPGRYAVDLAGRTALPFVCVVMALIGIPFGIRETRRGGWGVATGISLALGLAYWIIHSLAISLGRGGILPAWIAAWTANGIFLALGAALLIQKRQ